MTEKNKPLSASRQKELVFINRVLAILVVVLAFAAGLLLALREELLVGKTSKVMTAPETTVATASSNLDISTPPATLFFEILKSARYDRVLVDEPLTQPTLFKLLWAAQGKITTWGERTVPSYKSTYPVTMLVFIRQVEKTPSGWYKFNAETQQLEPLATMPLTLAFPEDIPGLLQAPIIMVASVPSDLEKDGLTWNEAGGIAQNILLAATNEKLVTFLLPASTLPESFTSQLKQSKESLLWLMPVGQAKTQGIQKKGVTQ